MAKMRKHYVARIHVRDVGCRKIAGTVGAQLETKPYIATGNNKKDCIVVEDPSGYLWEIRDDGEGGTIIISCPLIYTRSHKLMVMYRALQLIYGRRVQPQVLAMSWTRWDAEQL